MEDTRHRTAVLVGGILEIGGLFLPLVSHEILDKLSSFAGSQIYPLKKRR